MAIPEAQLETWSHQGAVATSARAYAAIRAALDASTSPVRGSDKEVFLQGSYRSSTNIYADSDVDVVVQLNETFGSDVSLLTSAEVSRHDAAWTPAAYPLHSFKADVVAALTEYFGAAAVTVGNRAVKVTGPGGTHLTADVIPAIHFRKYTRLPLLGPPEFIDGIRFDDSAGNILVNFPKAHIANGEAKNALFRTQGRYKSAVRMFKNARSCLVDRGVISNGVAPSYFVECLLCNAPDSLFVDQRQQLFPDVLNYLWQSMLAEQAMCQNGLILLFGDGHAQWNTAAARQFLGGLVDLWNGW